MYIHIEIIMTYFFFNVHNNPAVNSKNVLIIIRHEVSKNTGTQRKYKHYKYIWANFTNKPLVLQCQNTQKSVVHYENILLITLLQHRLQ